MARTTHIGPRGGNKCCRCCGKCTEERPLNEGSCPAHCCPCPPTGNVCVQFADPENNGLCPNLMASCFTMSPAAVTGAAANPPPGEAYDLNTQTYNEYCPGPDGYGPSNNVAGNLCYEGKDLETGCFPCGPGNDPNKVFVKSLFDWPFEKWSFEGTICATEGCGGEKLKISLCCCDLVGAANQAPGFYDDCHACRYQFRWGWQPQPGTSEYCTCPALSYFDEYFVPSEDCSPPGPGEWSWNMQSGVCGSGVPEAFGGNEGWSLTFNLDDVCWNCDCCQGGGQRDTTTPIHVVAIVTPEPPGGCC